MYQSFLMRKSLDTLDIRVTDARGRSLANGSFLGRSQNPGSSHGPDHLCLQDHPDELN